VGMGRLRKLVNQHSEEIRSLARVHGARSIALFGSVARGEETASSDLDFLVEFEPGRTLFDLIDIQCDLEDLLGVGIDVVSVGGLKERDKHMREEALAV